MKKAPIILAILIVILDQISKLMAVKYLTYPIKVTSFFNLALTYNRGISFGLLNQVEYSNYIFTLLTIIIIGFLLKWFKDSVILTEVMALSLVIGGAFGNLLDRLYQPGVVDFIQLHWKMQYYWPNFNLADSAICLGVAILMICNFKNTNRDA